MATGVLVVNLGTPNSPEPEDVGIYLKQFLMDPLVIDVPAPLRWILVNLLIVPKRKNQSAEAYESIWTEEGSPLRVYSESFADRLQKRLGHENFHVELAMRYGQPAIHDVLEKMMDEGINEFLIVPMYPQFAASSTITALREVKSFFQKNKIEDKKVIFLRDFFDLDAFLVSYTHQIRKVASPFQPDHYLFSYHGLPERHIKNQPGLGQYCLKVRNCCEQIDPSNNKCYRAQCFATTRSLSNLLSLEDNQYSTGFQSRLGRTPWIQPYSDFLVRDLARKGVKRLVVVCPSFVCDCLETLEEIRIRAMNDFRQEGGQELALVPSLNAEMHWVEGFAKEIEAKQGRWRKLF